MRPSAAASAGSSAVCSGAASDRRATLDRGAPSLPTANGTSSPRRTSRDGRGAATSIVSGTAHLGRGDSEDHSHSHSHSHSQTTTDTSRLVSALVLIAAFMVFEVTMALLAHSVALFADAGHMVSDVAALVGAIVAARLAARPATGTLTFGYQRAEILSALGNGLGLVIVSAFVCYGAVRRLLHPAAVHGLTLVVVAVVGIAVNLLATSRLGAHTHRSLNVTGAYRHILADLYAFIGTLVAGVVIATTGFRRADPIASLLVVALMLRAAVQLLGPSIRILAEATPDDVDLGEVRRHLLELDEVVAVHDLHAWTLTSSRPVLTAHIVVTDVCLHDGSTERILDHLQDCLADHFDIEHSTFQIEPVGHLDHERHGHD
jgi:cobalt-zinc-cadmium efflux system protein